MICYLFPEPLYLFFSDQVPILLYYAQIPATVIALIVSFYAFWNGRNILLNQLLFVISILFSLWTISTLIAWTNIHSDLIIFTWSFLGIILSLISVFSIYFIHVFLNKKDISVRFKVFLLALVFPTLFFASTYHNLSGFNITNCDAFDFEWFPYKIYNSALGVLSFVWILILLIKKYKISNFETKKEIILMGTGIELFLFSFFGMEFLGTYFVKIGLFINSEIELYGMFGMVIFMIYISILMVNFKLFNVKLFATQALVWGLIILIGSQFLFIKTKINFLLNGITFLGTIVFGFLLIKSVKKEVKQKEQLLLLNINLQKLIQQKESLMHLINHKVKGSFTHTKYIFSEIIEGSFGVITPELKKMAELGLESDELGVRTIDLILNASNLQKGIVKYNFKPFSFKDLVAKIVETKKDIIVKKGLELEIDIMKEDCVVNGDIFWLEEVVNNLIDNSANYTNKGKIVISLQKQITSTGTENKILFSVKDTGVGITKEDRKNLFTEGGRGKDSVKTNVNSTGYGLFTVKLIVEAHKGKIWVDSLGKDLGSTFFVELDCI